jgi:hypothetical protein
MQVFLHKNATWPSLTQPSASTSTSSPSSPLYAWLVGVNYPDTSNILILSSFRIIDQSNPGLDVVSLEEILPVGVRIVGAATTETENLSSGAVSKVLHSLKEKSGCMIVFDARVNNTSSGNATTLHVVSKSNQRKRDFLPHIQSNEATLFHKQYANDRHAVFFP